MESTARIVHLRGNLLLTHSSLVLREWRLKLRVLEQRDKLGYLDGKSQYGLMIWPLGSFNPGLL